MFTTFIILSLQTKVPLTISRRPHMLTSQFQGKDEQLMEWEAKHGEKGPRVYTFSNISCKLR